MPTQQCGDEQNQQWIVVTKNKSKHKGSLINKQIHGRGSQNILKAEHKQQCIQKFVNDKSFEFNKKMIAEALDKLRAIKNLDRFHVECLGLGNFQANKKSFIQLQLLQLIIIPIIKEIITKKQSINSNKKSEKPLLISEQLSINVYDPAFTKKQIEHLNERNYSSVEKFQIKKELINVFFMPHCERFLFEAVYRQYEKIQDKSLTPLILIGNSIKEYKDRCLLIKEQIPDIFLKIKPQEERIFDFQNALNDTFIMV